MDSVDPVDNFLIGSLDSIDSVGSIPEVLDVHKTMMPRCYQKKTLMEHVTKKRGTTQNIRLVILMYFFTYGVQRVRRQSKLCFELSAHNFCIPQCINFKMSVKDSTNKTG